MNATVPAAKWEFPTASGQSRWMNTPDEFARCPLHLQLRPNFSAAANRRGVPTTGEDMKKPRD